MKEDPYIVWDHNHPPISIVYFLGGLILCMVGLMGFALLMVGIGYLGYWIDGAFGAGFATCVMFVIIGSINHGVSETLRHMFGEQ